MAQYISKDAAVTEVERRISSLHPKGGQGIAVTKILKDHYKDFLSFLNTLEAKEVQEEPVSKDLEEASKKWLRPQLDKSYAAYGLLRQMELTHFDGYAMLDAIEFGAKWKERQMIKDSIDVELDDVCGFLTISIPYHNGIAGNKVKVIVIKED